MLVYILSKVIKKIRLYSIKNSTIDKNSKIESGTNFINSSMARHSFCGYDCSIINTEIGAFCSIASNVKIGGVAHPVHFASTSPVFLSHKDSVCRTKTASRPILPTLPICSAASANSKPCKAGRSLHKTSAHCATSSRA